MSPRESSGNAVDPGTVALAASGYKRGVLPARAPSAQATLKSPTPVIPDTPPAIQGVPDAWFGPLNPLPSNAPNDVKGRSFDYLTGYNVTTNNNRLGEASYTELRNLARFCDLVNIAIDKRKDQMEVGTWDWKLKDDRSGLSSKRDPRIQQLRDFFAFPDKRRSTNRWVRKLMDDILICDAPCIWVQKDKMNRPLQMRIVDTATIKPLINADGELPLPQEGPAFQQWIKGVPAGLYTTDEMLWLPRNQRPDKLFGYSPVQQIYVTVNTAIRRALLILAGYTEGSIPEAIVPVPEGWKQAEIVNFQIYWDELLSGNFGEQRRFRFVPNGIDKAIFTKKWEEKTDYDEWLARIIMDCFRLSAQPYIKQAGRANAEQAEDAATDAGQVPMVNFIKEIFNTLNWKFFGYTDIEAVFHLENMSNALEQAQADKIRTESGHMSIDELRTEELGLEPIGQGPAVFVASQGMVPIGEGNSGVIAPPAPQPGGGFGDDVQKLIKAAKARKRFLRQPY